VEGQAELTPHPAVRAVTADQVAAVAAITLTETGHEGATYTLTGPASITHTQIAAALTAALGRTVTYVDAPPRVFADNLAGILPPWQVAGLLEDYAHYRRGEAAAVSPASPGSPAGRPSMSSNSRVTTPRPSPADAQPSPSPAPRWSRPGAALG
jgi:uncharacterized protein YbjT (DUF2867 family)